MQSSAAACPTCGTSPVSWGSRFWRSATTFLGTPLLTFLPVFTQDVFRGGVGQYTQLMACAGAGAVSGALVVAWRGRSSGMGRTLLMLQLTFGALVALFAVTRVIWINSVLLFGAGACMVMVFAMLSSLVQHIAPNEMRGRVMSIYMVAFRGGMPLGSLVAGYLATRTSAPTVLTINGVLLSLVAVWFLFKSDGVQRFDLAARLPPSLVTRAPPVSRMLQPMPGSGFGTTSKPTIDVRKGP